MADEQNNVAATSSRDILINNLELKNDYINDLAQAIDEHDDLRIYQLLGPLRYKSEITNSLDNKYGDHPFDLVQDQRAELAHFLGDNLIDYLIEKFPFFYYREVERGRFKVFFGNWWDRREFGELDTLNVEFNFDQTELKMLADTVELDADHKTYHFDEITELSDANVQLQSKIDTQKENAIKLADLQAQAAQLSDKGGLFESNKIKEERQSINDQITELSQLDQDATTAPAEMQKNQEKILALSKEDTTLGYEKDSLVKTFKTFESFENHVKRLYVDYLSSLIGKGSVNNNG